MLPDVQLPLRHEKNKKETTRLEDFDLGLAFIASDRIYSGSLYSPLIAPLRVSSAKRGPRVDSESPPLMFGPSEGERER